MRFNLFQYQSEYNKLLQLLYYTFLEYAKNLKIEEKWIKMK